MCGALRCDISVDRGLEELSADRVFGRRTRALIAEPPAPPTACVIEGEQGRRLHEQVKSLIAQLEPAATFGSSALVGQAAEVGDGDSMQRALEECTGDWARSRRDRRGTNTWFPRGAGTHARRCARRLKPIEQQRRRAEYRAALEDFRGALRRLTADATMGGYR